MPKKLTGVNMKSVEAKARKDAVKYEKEVLKKREAEDKLWADNDPKLQKKQQRKEDKEQKKIQQIERKNTNKLLEQEELSSITAAKNNMNRNDGPKKKNRIEIERAVEKAKTTSSINKAKDSKIIVNPDSIPENLNRAFDMNTVAQSVDEAIILLNANKTEKDADLHPEKRLKAAHKAFEDELIPRLKAENPSLKLSQLKQMAWKEWQKVSKPSMTSN